VALAGLVQTNAALDALRLNNGSGLTNLNLVGSGGVTNITGGGTWTLANGSYTFVPATDASRAATGTVITVTANGNSGSVTLGTGGTIALGSDAGKVTTNATFSQLGVRDGSGLTNIPLSGLQTVPLTNNHASAVTLGGNLTVNGTANLAPNQTAASASSLMTRGLGDARWASRNISLPIGAENGTVVFMTVEPLLHALRYPTNATSASQWYFDTETLPSTNYVFRFYVCTDTTGTGTQTMRLAHYSHTLSTRSAVIDAKVLDVVLTSNVWVECAVTNSITVGAGHKVHRIQIGGITGSNALSGAAFFYSTNHRIEWLP
jgi:hypothetical protein